MKPGDKIDLMNGADVVFTIEAEDVTPNPDAEYHVIGKTEDGRRFESFGVYMKRTQAGRYYTSTYGIWRQRPGTEVKA